VKTNFALAATCSLCRSWVVALVGVLCLGTTAANAALVTWRATGVITGVANPTGAFPAAVTPNDVFVLDYTLETGTPDTNVLSTQGQYVYAIKQIYLNVGNGDFTRSFNTVPALAHITIRSDDPSGSDYFDTFSIQALSAPPLNGHQSQVDMTLQENSTTSPATSITSDSLPLFPPDPLTFANITQFALTESLYQQGQYAGRSALVGSVWSQSVAPVPLPAAAWLLLSGAGAMLVFVRRRT
jgi:hypothetical protein